MKIQIGVMGSADGEIKKEVLKRTFDLGKAIASHNCILVTGGCPGLPYEATKGAKSAGGLTVGISPGANLEEHVNKYESPIDDIDVMIYTGCGLMGRETTAIQSCDIVVITGGRSGTLGEYSIAYDQGKLIGILEDTSGITQIIKEITEVVHKPTGGQVIYDSDPHKLIDKLLEKLSGYQNRS